MKPFPHKTAVSCLILLFTGALFKLLNLPNQLIVNGVAFLLYLLIILPCFLGLLFKELSTIVSKIAAIIISLFILFSLVAIYMGVFEQGPIPIMTVAIMMVCIFSYFLRLHMVLKAQSPVIKKYGFLVVMSFILVFIGSPFISNLPDYYYNPSISHPTYEYGQGPVVFLDYAHFNRHTLDYRYNSFANILEEDGYSTRDFEGQFTQNNLRHVDLLVISNALNQKNVGNWSNPTFSAFSDVEIGALHDWVLQGGALFLIADHMPFGGAAEKLSNVFGFGFTNGHAGDTIKKRDVFNRQEATLHSNVITNGRNELEMVQTVETFSGQAFTIPDDATPILTFGTDYVQWTPEKAWKLRTSTPFSIEGWAQGAFKTHGKGKVVVFGEAAMFTGQLGGGFSWVKIGLNKPGIDNQQLLLNILHWMDGTLEE